jgi:hypothetical protein
MSFKKTFANLGLKVRKHSPEICGFVGTIAVIGGVIWACKATMDCSDKIKETKDNIEDIKTSIKDEVIEEKQGKKDIRGEWIECARVCAIKYAGPAVLLGGGLYLQHKSRKIMGKRLDLAAAGYAALNNKYTTLADNVKKQYGEEEFERLQYGLVDGVTEVRATDENGIETSKMQGFDKIVDRDKVGGFTIIFDNQSSRHFTDILHNEDLLRRIETDYTERLHREGVVWLCDILRDLDIRAKDQDTANMWRNICWIDDASRKDTDRCVKLRFTRVFDGNSKNYATGYDPVYILDPNYDSTYKNDWFKYAR